MPATQFEGPTGPRDSTTVLTRIYDRVNTALRISAIKRWLYDAADTVIFRTTGYGGISTPLTATEQFTPTIDLTGKENVKIEFKFDASGNTDNLTLSLYTSLDGDPAGWTGNEIAVWSTNVSNDGNEHEYYFTIGDSWGAGYYRFGMQSAGGTDTFQIQVRVRYFDEVLKTA